jgi:hypothetical protein
MTNMKGFGRQREMGIGGEANSVVRALSDSGQPRSIDTRPANLVIQDLGDSGKPER